MRHNEAVSQKGNMPRSHQNKRHQSASMPHYMATRQLFVVFQSSLGGEIKPVRFKLGKGSISPKSAANEKLVRRAISASSFCPSRSAGDLCYLVKSWTLRLCPTFKWCTKDVYLLNLGAWHTRMHTYENKNTKISSEDLTAIYTKICTSPNFPPYNTVPVSKYFIKIVL